MEQKVKLSSYSRKIEVYLFLIILNYYAYHIFISSFIFDFQNTDRIIKSVIDLFVLFWAFGILFARKIHNLYYGKFIFILFLVSTPTFLFNYDEIGFLTHLNGLRDPLFIIAVFILTYYIINEHTEYIFNFVNKSLLIFALINIPVSIYQFLLFGAGDGVGGTFLLGGSGLITQILFLLNFFFVLLYAPGLSELQINIKKFIIFLILLIPTFINETKITYLFFILYFAFLFKGTINIVKSTAILILGFILLNLFQIFYFETIGESNDMDIFTNKDYITAYLFNADERDDMSRFGRVQIGYELAKESPQKLFFGNGYGIFKGQNILGTVKKGDYLYYLYKGTVLFLFDALMQGGIVLIAFMTAFFIYSIKTIKRRNNRKINNFTYFIAIFIFISGIYNTFIYESFCILTTAYIISFLRHKNQLEEIQENITVS